MRKKSFSSTTNLCFAELSAQEEVARREKSAQKHFFSSANDVTRARSVLRCIYISDSQKFSKVMFQRYLGVEGNLANAEIEIAKVPGLSGT